MTCIDSPKSDEHNSGIPLCEVSAQFHWLIVRQPLRASLLGLVFLVTQWFTFTKTAKESTPDPPLT